MDMFTLKKLLTPFVLPPGIFICIFLVVGLLAMRRKKPWTAILFLAMGAMVWAASAGPVADRITGPLESGFTIPDDPQADVIIMLGGGVHARAPDLSGTGAPNQSTLERMVTTARLYRRLQVPIIVSGGSVRTSDASSAILTKRFLIDLGVPAEHILVDSQSRDTCENARFSHEICKRHGYRRPLVVTSGLHLKRAMHCFGKTGMQATPYPSGLTIWPDKQYYWSSWLPSANALSTTSAALHEWLGLIYFRFTD
jgi:uncharacterized SAM-binding protein YcdF (DUF218 family)